MLGQMFNMLFDRQTQGVLCRKSEGILYTQ